MPPFTRETLFNGTLSVCQPKDGYRFSVDPIILAEHLCPIPGERVLDMGCGCGIIPLLLAGHHPGLEIIGIEIQDELADLAKKNVRDNGFTNRISIIHGDIRTMRSNHLPGPPITTVISNPPYKKKDSGRLNPHSQKAVARHEVCLTLAECLDGAGRVLKAKGRFMVIYPAERFPELMVEMDSRGFAPQWARFIHTRKDRNAKLVLLNAVKGGNASFTVYPPLSLPDINENKIKKMKRFFNA